MTTKKRRLVAIVVVAALAAAAWLGGHALGNAILVMHGRHPQ